MMAEHRTYEMMVIFDSGLEDEKVDEKVKRLEEYITNGGGSVGGTTRWGKRKLAYPIRKKESGNYIILPFTLGAEQLQDFERGLKLDEQVLRYLVIRRDEK
jgi:small subunit ribosomal protein S6